MFASKEKNVGKKSFQKPNILRRKGKASKSQETNIHANFKSNASNTNIKHDGLEENAFNIEYFMKNASTIEQDLPIAYEGTISTEKEPTQTKPKWCFDITNNSMDIIINNYKETPLGDFEEKLDSVIVVPSEPVSGPVPEQQPDPVHSDVAAIAISQPSLSLATPPTTQTTPVSYTSRAVKFKCDQPNCNKGFWSEEKLKKHKNSHKRQAYRTPTQITYECPVKKKVLDGLEEKCPRTFDVRGDLLKHLDDDHTLDDAQYRCEVCGRRFFWAMGLRGHGTALCARGGLACAWPGCGRVFRQPCRLREHARAHTGDRPYRCQHPECGWAFRSASKLLRHARRHTDERRHACATCGRAFLRREHLRDHAARYHLRAARTAHHCTHPGCEQSFTNMSTLYMHMKKVHRKGKEEGVASVPETPPANVTEQGDYVYLVSLPDNVVLEEECNAVSSVSGERGEVSGAVETDVAGLADEHVNEDSAVSELAVSEHGDSELAGQDVAVASEDVASEDVASEDVAEWHAARTHCTWPLPRAAHAHYVLDDDVHVELAEGSVSDVYTVRSDLFLHGNVPIDDDSQQIVGAALSGEAGAMDADLCLIDAHPTIDLMQEELMYEDAADESSFRVFLMNGEELT